MNAEVEGEENNHISFPQLRFVMSTDWRDDARCAKLPKDVFFAYSNDLVMKERQNKINSARAVCRECSVKDKCYEFAVKNNEPHGIWAGTLPDERRRLFKLFTKTGILETLQEF